MRYCAVNLDTDQVVSQPPNPLPKNIAYVFIPRIRCHDCPGKLYTPGPELTLKNFEVHLKNKNHREKVNARVAGEGASGGVNRGSSGAHASS